MTKWLATSVIVLAAATAPATQSLQPVSAEDLLNVKTANVLDFSDDGRKLAVGVRRLHDNAETNHRRYGDPTYFAPSMVELMVINTATGAGDRVGKGLMNVRQAALTANGSKLAVLTAAETAAGLPTTTLWVYDAERKTLAEVPRQAGAEVAANSELAWTPDGDRKSTRLNSS